jgi:serine/threonine-protein kinase
MEPTPSEEFSRDAAPTRTQGAGPWLNGAIIGDRYVIERELGRGATSIVYLARDVRDDGMVALKVLRPELAQSLSANGFLREIDVTTQLNHPSIVPVLDSGNHEGTLYFVLPYAKGGTLRGRLERERQLPITDALAIGATLADALEYAHAHNLMHRDVKPENILFDDDRVALADFGIAKAIERAAGESTTITGVVRGTPAYMSPEQAGGEHGFDGRSDIYSLGCVVYEMIAGVQAFVGPTPQSVLAQRMLHTPRPLAVYRPTTPRAIADVVNRALARVRSVAPRARKIVR